MSFFSRLETRARQADTLLCIGLDPHSQDLPTQSGAAARDYCLRLIEATAEYAATYKPNIAFFEVYGPEGIAALQEVIAAIPDEIPVLLDAKRGDIASTAQAYAQAVFQTLGADAVTINPYLGRDAVQPFLEDPEKGVFLLCKTSNPGAADLQDLHVGTGETLYEHVARLAQSWNQHNNLGLVVGATQLDALARVRTAAPQLWLLAPGVGAQGGDLEAALAAGLRPDGLGMLVPVSRGIARAQDPGKAAQELCAAINQARAAQTAAPVPHFPVQLADALLEAGCIKFGSFTLKSGQQSPIYIDLRRLVAHPQLLDQVAAAYIPLLQKLTFDQLAAIPYAALPIATAISLQSGWPLVYPRREAKAYGTKANIEGVYESGQRVALIDDLVTTGGSKFESVEKLTDAGLIVEDVVVLIDRGSGAAETLAAGGLALHAVFTLPQLLDHWAATGKVSAEHIQATHAFLAS